MPQFIELPVIGDDDESETKLQLINVAAIGRIFASPQNSRRSMVELNYHSINDAPVFLEVEMAYEVLRVKVLAS